MSVLQQLADNRVVEFEVEGDTCIAGEMCDQAFAYTLTITDMTHLIQELCDLQRDMVSYARTESERNKLISDNQIMRETIIRLKQELQDVKD